MQCRLIKVPGGVAFACGRAPARKCQSCRARAGDLQCDYPVKRAADKSQTCDRYLCYACATEIGENLHYCPVHTKIAREAGDERVFNSAPKIEARTTERYPERRPVKKMPARFSSTCPECEERVSERDTIYYLPECFVSGIGKLKSAALCQECGDNLGYDKYAK